MVEIKGYKHTSLIVFDMSDSQDCQDCWVTHGFCIYCSSAIKIFYKKDIWKDDYDGENFKRYLYGKAQDHIKEINEELNLKWWQKILRFILSGYLCSNISCLYATIYDKDKLNFWQKAINFISFGYFYPTTARIEVEPMSKYSVRFKYSSSLGSLDGNPVLWKFKEKSSEIEGEWVECADLPGFSPTKEIEEYVGLNDPVNTGEPRENKDITHEKHFLAWGNSSGPKLNQNVPVPLCIQQNMLNSDKLDADERNILNRQNINQEKKI